jgi:hypothetical protein
MQVWTQDNTVQEALQLPVGSYAADFGFLVQQSVNPKHVLEAAQAFKESNTEVMVASQAGLLVKAQEAGLAFETWAPIKVC